MLFQDFHTQYDRIHSAIKRIKGAEQSTLGPVLFVNVAKHDHHSFELKTAIEYYRGQKFSIDTESYLFLPRAAHLTSWSTDTIRKDFTPHIRLSVPFYCDHGKTVLESAQEKVQAEISKMKKNPATSTTLGEACKNLAAIFNEVLKNYLLEHKKKISLASQTPDLLSQQAHLLSLTSSVNEFTKKVYGLRLLWPSGIETIKPSILCLLDEYISNLFIHYIGDLRELLNKHSKIIGSLAEYKEALELLQKIGQNESEYRNENLNSNALNFDNLPYRMNYLKKYFQSSLFFDVVAKQGLKKYSEPAAILGALIAASGAYFLEGLSNNPTTVQFAASGSLIMSLGVFLYVLKDRMKDYFRNTVLQTIGKYLPDVELQLYAKKKYIGKIKSWLRTDIGADALPANVRLARHKASSDHIENNIPEDVLLYRTCIEVGGLSTTDKDLVAGLREGTRINIERYLKHFDDPFKSYYFLESDGTANSKQTRRTYQFYLFVNSKCSLNNSNSKFHINRSMFRIILNKNGIQEIEPLKVI